MLKRITLFVALFIGCMAFTHAQNVIFEEDFSNAIGQNVSTASLTTLGWSLYTEDAASPISNGQYDLSFLNEAWVAVRFQGPGETMASASMFQQPADADRWAVTPQISLPTSNPTLFFDALSGNANAPGSYEILVSTTGNTPADFTDAPILAQTAPTGALEEQVVSLASYAGQDIYIAFRNTTAANAGYILIIDNIKVVSMPDVEVALDHIDINDFVATGNVPVSGTIINNGATAISSFDVTWSVDGGTPQTETVSGVNVTTLDSYNFTLSTPWNAASVGDHTISIDVSNINGAGADQDNTDNSLSKNIYVASNSVQRIPLYEEFTSATCPPCAVLNPQLYDPFFANLADSTFSLVKYPVSWPAEGDPYFTNEVSVRRAYYGVNAAPTMLIEGEVVEQQNLTVLQNGYQEAVNKPAFFKMSLDVEKNSSSVKVTVNTDSYLEGDFTLYVAVVEKLTFGNANTPNNAGETDFFNTFLKMLPTANGVTINATDGGNFTHTFGPYDMSSTFVEEMSDLQVVAWIADGNHNVMQSAHSDNFTTLGVESNKFDALTMYPNPAEGFLHIAAQDPVDVTIVNTLGQEVFAQKNVTKDTQLNIADLSSGIYFVNIQQHSSVITKKLIIE